MKISQEQATFVRRLAALALAVLAVGALGGCGDDADAPASEESSYVPVKETPCLDCFGPKLSVREPGRDVEALFQGDEEVWSAVTSTWLVDTDRSRTMVQAGSGGVFDRTDGLLVVSQEDHTSPKDESAGFTFRQQGPVTLTEAPRGEDVQNSAQYNGVIKFRVRGGITGVLRLRNKTISLDCAGPCPRVVRSYSD